MSKAIDQLNNFRKYLYEANEKVQKSFPGAKFYNGEYRPDIFNFHYEYNFANDSTGIKVVVNTFEGNAKLLIIPTPRNTNGLNPINLPINLGMIEAYEIAKANGQTPNLLEAIVFLQDDIQNSSDGAQYWFLDGNGPEWITVNVDKLHIVKETKANPVNP